VGGLKLQYIVVMKYNVKNVAVKADKLYIQYVAYVEHIGSMA